MFILQELTATWGSAHVWLYFRRILIQTLRSCVVSCVFSALSTASTLPPHTIPPHSLSPSRCHTSAGCWFRSLNQNRQTWFWLVCITIDPLHGCRKAPVTVTCWKWRQVSHVEQLVTWFGGVAELPHNTDRYKSSIQGSDDDHHIKHSWSRRGRASLSKNHYFNFQQLVSSWCSINHMKKNLQDLQLLMMFARQQCLMWTLVKLAALPAYSWVWCYADVEFVFLSMLKCFQPRQKSQLTSCLWSAALWVNIISFLGLCLNIGRQQRSITLSRRLAKLLTSLIFTLNTDSEVLTSKHY